MTNDLLDRLRGVKCGDDPTIEEAVHRIALLEIALMFMIRNEEVNEAFAKTAGEQYVNKGLDFAKMLLGMEKKDGLS